MAMECEVCGKKPMYGHNISHAHNVTSRRFNPNLQQVKAVLNGVTKKIRACTRCIRSGKVIKPAKREIPAPVVAKASA